MHPHLEDTLQHIPDLPGVYFHKNQKGEILYIGKAKSLRKRVRSYFQPSAKHNLRIRIMVSLVYDITTLITDSEAEALVLEAQLIKAHQPRYNVALKDDKSYPFFKLTTTERYPRLFLVREKPVNKAEYFGPYPSLYDARRILQIVNKHFQLRTSKMDLDGNKTYRPCLNFQLKRCLAPCQGNVERQDYQQVVKQVRMFLQGKDKQLRHDLQEQMTQASEALEFEKAAKIRDQIQAIQRIFERHTVLTPEIQHQDVYAMYRESDIAGVQVLFVRNGRLLGTDFFYFEFVEQTTDENLLGKVLNQVYTGEHAFIPQQILLPFAYSDEEALLEGLNQVATHPVKVLLPQRGHKKDLLDMAEKNAKLNLLEKQSKRNQDREILQQVQQTLSLSKIPDLVEAFDISNISGKDSVASMVSWKGNQPNRQAYRKFKIQTVDGPNDFASMEEVLTRRYQKSVRGEVRLPDLILIDGGKGQLSIAMRVLEELGISLEEVDVIGFAKGRSERRKKKVRPAEEDYEYVVKPNRKNEIRLSKYSPVLYFLQNIRDESHRFAITFHRQLRRKNMIKSILDQIKGIGTVKKKKLLQHFGSLKKIKGASVAELVEVQGIHQELAEKIYFFLQDVE